MSTEPETPQQNSLFDWIRYVVIACLAVVVIWWALQPPGDKDYKSGETADESSVDEQSGGESALIRCDGTTMGTVPYCVKVSGWKSSLTPAEAEKLLSKTVRAELDLVDSLMSTYRSESDVSRFNRSDSTDWFSVAPETAKVVQVAQEVSELTRGTFDITVGPLVNRWGFGPEEFSTPPSQEEIDELLQSVGYRHLAVQMNPPSIKKDVPRLEIDLSGIAKGYAVDQVAAALQKQGIVNSMIEVGGETRTAGEKSPDKPWTIGIEIPTPQWLGEPKIQRKIQLGAKSMATSGDYNNFVDYKEIRFSHIIDPRTGWPTEKTQLGLANVRLRLGSLSVVDSTCIRADALTKGFYVLGVEEGLKLANDNGIAVLFLLREEIPDKRGPGPRFTVKEVVSDAFQKTVKTVD